MVWCVRLVYGLDGLRHASSVYGRRFIRGFRGLWGLVRQFKGWLGAEGLQCFGFSACGFRV